MSWFKFLVLPAVVLFFCAKAFGGLEFVQATDPHLLGADFNPGSPRITSDLVLQPASTLTMTVEPTNNTCSGVLYILNDGKETSHTLLSAGDFVSYSQGKLLNARAVISTPGETVGKIIFDLTVPPGQVLPIQIEVSGLWEAGESTASLYSNGVVIGKLKAIKYRPPFNVRLDIPTTDKDKPELTLERGKDCWIPLRNDDPMTYPIKASLTINGCAVELPAFTLSPNGSRSVKVETSDLDSCFSAAGYLKDDLAEGVLSLAFVPPGEMASAGWPQRTIAFRAHLRPVSQFYQIALSTATIFILLLAGGLCSWLLNNYIPNRSRRAVLIRKLDQLNADIDSLSLIDSSVRVVMGVQRNQLATRLREHWAISADFTTTADQVDGCIAILNRQWLLASKIDAALNKLYQLDQTQILPSRLLAIIEAIPPLVETLERPEPTATDLDAIEPLVAVLQAKVHDINKIDLSDIKPDLAKLDNEMWDAVANPPRWRSPFARLATVVSDLFTSLDRWRKTAPTDSDVTQVADLLVRGALLKHFVGLSNCSADETQQFVSHLNAGSPEDLRSAWKLVDQLEAKELIRAISHRDDGMQALYISRSPTNVVSQIPVKFEMKFADQALDRSRAKRNITCVWSFEHGGWMENGWRVQHYFPFETKDQAKHTIKAWFKTSDGIEVPWNPPDPQNPGRREVWTEFSIGAPNKGRTNHENIFQLVRLGIVLGFALLGLMAGAREQLSRLDLLPAAIAIFVLGFTADAVRAALSTKASP